MKLAVIVPLTIFLSITFCLSSNGWGAAVTPNTDDLHNLIRSMVDPSLEFRPGAYGPAPGAVLRIDGPDFHFLEAAGYADVAKKTPVKPNDRFGIGSSTMMFTAVLLVQLAEQEVLNLNDSLAKWLPEWAARIPDSNEITLSYLASHASGIRDYSDELFSAGLQDSTTLTKQFTPKELVRLAMDSGSPNFPPFPPGNWRYSNTGFILLGMIMEKATGKKISALLQEKIFDPLKLADTTFPDSVPPSGSLVHGYASYPDGPNVTAWNLSQGWAASGIISTATDLRTFLRALAQGSLFKDPSTVLALGDFVRNKSIREHAGVPGYGLGLMEYTRGVWGHDGQSPGFENVLMFVPGTEYTVVALTNTSQGPILHMRNLASMLQAMAGVDPVQTPEFPRPEPQYSNKRPLDFTPFAGALKNLSSERIHALDSLLLASTVPQIRQLLADAKITSEELVLYFINRIQRYDFNVLNSVIELNMQVLTTASKMDRERAAGKTRGPLHGIPVLLKDNIVVKGMHTTAGAWAMRNWMPNRDSELVENLRRAGALIMGKANLSEWANYMDPSMPSGFSALGGQVRNPYGPFEVLGSSSGSAVAASANFAAVTVGTETQGSIIKPASINGVAALKPSRGLISGDQIIPLVDWMDVPGPMGRSVTDVAVLLSAMTGRKTNYSKSLSLDAARDMRVGIIVLSPEAAARRARLYDVKPDRYETLAKLLVQEDELNRQAAEPFQDTGVELIKIDALELPPPILPDTVLPYGFRDSLNRFLAKLGKNAPVMSLADIVRINGEDPVNRAPYGQSYLIGALNSPMTGQEYETLARRNRETAAKALAGIFRKHRIKALITSSQAYAPAGFPAITVPAGYRGNGEPFGLVMIGNDKGEDNLITAAFAYEQSTRARNNPDLDNTMQQILQTRE